MNNYFKNTAVITTILLTTGLFSCEKNQDVIPATPASTSGTDQASLIIVKSRLAKVGKTVLTYGANGKLDKADDQHHRIQYTYPAGNQILVSHFYNNALAWTNLITLDGNGRAGSSKSTDLSATKKYALDERVLNYAYDNGRLVSIKPTVGARADQSEYVFNYNPDSDLESIFQKNAAGNQASITSFGYGYYVQSGKFLHNIPVTPNNKSVNENLHLSQFGPESLGDVIDFFLPIYGTMSSHLINGVVVFGAGNGVITESHYFTYDLAPTGNIETAYTMEEATTPFVYELIK
ncbi:hypothetical protein [Spirosoma areae]